MGATASWRRWLVVVAATILTQGVAESLALAEKDDLSTADALRILAMAPAVDGDEPLDASLPTAPLPSMETPPGQAKESTSLVTGDPEVDELLRFAEVTDRAFEQKQMEQSAPSLPDPKQVEQHKHAGKKGVKESFQRLLEKRAAAVSSDDDQLTEALRMQFAKQRDEIVKEEQRRQEQEYNERREREARRLAEIEVGAKKRRGGKTAEEKLLDGPVVVAAEVTPKSTAVEVETVAPSAPKSVTAELGTEKTGPVDEAGDADEKPRFREARKHRKRKHSRAEEDEEEEEDEDAPPADEDTYDDAEDTHSLAPRRSHRVSRHTRKHRQRASREEGGAPYLRFRQAMSMPVPVPPYGQPASYAAVPPAYGYAQPLAPYAQPVPQPFPVPAQSPFGPYAAPPSSDFRFAHMRPPVDPYNLDFAHDVAFSQRARFGSPPEPPLPDLPPPPLAPPTDV